MLDIYTYSSGHQYLRDFWKEKNQKNPSFSLRAWARQLGFKGHAPLQLMLSGKRAIPRKYLPRMIQHLELSPQEGLFLETLLELDSAETPGERKFFLERLRGISPKPLARVFEVEHFAYLRNPLHMFILEMSELPDFDSDPKWIQSRIRYTVSLQEIEEVLDRLIALGLLSEAPDGSVRKTHKHLNTRNDVTDKAIQDYHKNVSDLAAKQVGVQTVNDREFQGMALNVSLDALPLAKKLIREFTRQFLAAIEAPAGAGRETYQLNVQFFSITQTKEKP